MCITIYYKSDFGVKVEVPLLPGVTEGRRFPPRSPPYGVIFLHCRGESSVETGNGSDDILRVAFREAV